MVGKGETDESSSVENGVGAGEQIKAVATHKEWTFSRRNGRDSGFGLTVYSPGRHKKHSQEGTGEILALG
jgi:hypothetical protein